MPAHLISLTPEERLSIVRSIDIVIEFANKTWEELEFLSIDGIIGPSIDEAAPQKLLLGEKLVWFTIREYANKFISEFGHLGYIAVKENSLIQHELAYKQNIDVHNQFMSIVVYNNKNSSSCQAYELFCKAWDIYKYHNLYGHRLQICHDIVLGLSLGYNKNDIAKFVIHNFCKKTFEKWKSEILG